MRLLGRIAALAATLVLANCAEMSSIHRTFNIANNQSQLIDVKQRAIFIAPDPDDPTGQRHIVCPEPSPDAMSVYAGTLAAQADSLPFNISGGSSENGEAFGLRTQTIQIMRDQVTAMCLAYLSGAANKYEYAYMLRRYADQTIAALAIEQLTTAIRPQIVPLQATAPTIQNPFTTTHTTTETTTSSNAAPATGAAAAPAAPVAVVQPSAAHTESSGDNSQPQAQLIPAAYITSPDESSGNNSKQPNCSLKATPTSVAKGGAFKLSWTTANASKFAIDNDVGTVNGASGDKDLTMGDKDTTYTGIASGDGGTTSNCTAKVTLTAPDPPASPAVATAAAVLDITKTVLQEDYGSQMCFSQFQKEYDDQIALAKFQHNARAGDPSRKGNEVEIAVEWPGALANLSANASLHKFCENLLNNYIRAYDIRNNIQNFTVERQNWLISYLKAACLKENPSMEEKTVCAKAANGILDMVSDPPATNGGGLKLQNQAENTAANNRLLNQRYPVDALKELMLAPNPR
jgi:hypothetical protein